MATLPEPFDVRDYAAKKAADFLAENDFEPAIAILEGDDEIRRPLRDAFAALLRGQGPNGMSLVLKPVEGHVGRPKRGARNFHRDYDLYNAVEATLARDVHGRAKMSVNSACVYVAKNHPIAKAENLSAKSVYRAYSEMSKASDAE